MAGCKSVFAVAIILVLVLIPLSCAINPVTGKNEFMLVSEQDEISLGKQADQEISQAYGFYDNPALADYVNGVGQNISKNTQRPNNEYHFQGAGHAGRQRVCRVRGIRVRDTRHSGLHDDEAELAGVIGHELGHENARHIAQQMSRQQVTQLGFSVA